MRIRCTWLGIHFPAQKAEPDSSAAGLVLLSFVSAGVLGPMGCTTILWLPQTNFSPQGLLGPCAPTRVGMLPDCLLSSARCHTVLKVLKETEVIGLSGQTQLSERGAHGPWKQARDPPLGGPALKVI